MRERIDRRSASEGLTTSRLPLITPEWSTILKGSCDFIGLNHYSCEAVTRDEAKLPRDVAPIRFTCSKDKSFPWDEEAFHFYSPGK